MKPRLSAVLFDLDGTLLDTAPDFIRCLNLLRHDLGLEALPDSVIRPAVSNGAQAMIRVSFGQGPGDSEYEARLNAFLNRYEADVAEHTVMFPGMDQVLSDLQDAQIPWGIVTNKPARFTTPLIAALGLRAGAVICPDHVAQRKPHPESIYLACQQLGTAPRHGIYVGDHQRDIEAGRRAGMTTVAASYGYINDPSEISAWLPDHVVASPSALRVLLQTRLNQT